MVVGVGNAGLLPKKPPEMTTENVDHLWDFWIGSKMLVGKELKRPVNLLGSVKQHKKLFMEASEQWIKNNTK